MDSYNREQIEALTMVRRHVDALTPEGRQALVASLGDYLAFRQDVGRFQAEYFGDICARKCYQSQMSACCSKEGIVTFFADVVVNALLSTKEDLDRLEAALKDPGGRNKCVYLTPSGCMWRMTPIVCAMFLCESACREVFSKTPAAGEAWKEMKERRKRFTWPDRPVLFDDLEQVFIDAGCQSALMYLHNSPGMLRVKNRCHKRAPGSQ